MSISKQSSECCEHPRYRQTEASLLCNGVECQGGLSRFFSVENTIDMLSAANMQLLISEYLGLTTGTSKHSIAGVSRAIHSNDVRTENTHTMTLFSSLGLRHRHGRGHASCTFTDEMPPRGDFSLPAWF